MMESISWSDNHCELCNRPRKTRPLGQNARLTDRATRPTAAAAAVNVSSSSPSASAASAARCRMMAANGQTDTWSDRQLHQPCRRPSVTSLEQTPRGNAWTSDAVKNTQLRPQAGCVGGTGRGVIAVDRRSRRHGHGEPRQGAAVLADLLAAMIRVYTWIITCMVSKTAGVATRLRCCSVMHGPLLLLMVAAMSILAVPLEALPTDSRSGAANKASPKETSANRGPVDGLNFLMSYGYLPYSDLETENHSMRSEQELRQAIQSFQRFAHLPDTGELDSRTRAKMQRPRCGLPDILESSSGYQGRRRKRYALASSKWPHKNLTFRILNYTPDLVPSDVRDAIYRAFSMWSDVTQLTFTEVLVGSVDIQIKFRRGYHGDGYPFDGPGLVLAHAFFPGEDRGGDVHFDDDESWTLYRKDGTDLYSVAAHEIGHSLGLAHSSVTGALMYPWYKGYDEQLSLHGDDIVAIQYLYGYRDPVRRPPNPTVPATGTRQPQTRPPPPPLPTTTAPDPSRTTTLVSTTPYPRYVPSGDAPDPCTTSVDAVAVIRSEVYIFKGHFFWRINEKGVMPGYPVELDRFWYGFPKHMTHIDAVYEVSRDDKIVFFQGKRYWMYKGNHLVPDFPEQGRPITELGLPPDIERVDAAFVWGYNRKTYFITGDMYWRYNEDRKKMDYGYPRDMSMWEGVPVPVDAAFLHWDGRTYFFHGQKYWEFKDARMKVRSGYPKTVGVDWLECPANLEQTRSGTGALVQCGLSNLMVVNILFFVLVVLLRSEGPRLL